MEGVEQHAARSRLNSMARVTRSRRRPFLFSTISSVSYKIQLDTKV
ncbi:MAG: hypothetical protein SW833_13920 [Cyanobacteriota bacterium]|nr:hypothetical protein [Cyanobacteriota bacterium]